MTKHRNVGENKNPRRMTKHKNVEENKNPRRMTKHKNVEENKNLRRMTKHKNVEENKNLRRMTKHNVKENKNPRRMTKCKDVEENKHHPKEEKRKKTHPLAFALFSAFYKMFMSIKNPNTVIFYHFLCRTLCIRISSLPVGIKLAFNISNDYLRDGSPWCHSRFPGSRLPFSSKYRPFLYRPAIRKA